MKVTKVEISEDTHRLLKVYCAQNGLRMGNFVDLIIHERINNADDRRHSDDAIKSEKNGNLQNH